MEIIIPIKLKLNEKAEKIPNCNEDMEFEDGFWNLEQVKNHFAGPLSYKVKQFLESEEFIEDYEQEIGFETLEEIEAVQKHFGLEISVEDKNINFLKHRIQSNLKCFVAGCGEDYILGIIAEDEDNAKHIAKKDELFEDCGLNDIEITLKSEIDVSDLQRGIIEPLEGLKRGIYSFYEGTECPNCKKKGATVYYDNDEGLEM